MNLALNARDAMPRGGRLRIQTMNADVDDQFFKRRGIRDPDSGRRFVALVVSDTGTGMDATTRRRMFEPFFTTKPKGKGTGLGLATVHGIVSQSRGAIWVESEPGEGTTFNVYLPRTDETKSVEVAPAASEPSSTGDETILLVEDDEAVRELSRALLERRGYRVITAVNAEEAIARAAEEAGTDSPALDRRRASRPERPGAGQIPALAPAADARCCISPGNRRSVHSARGADRRRSIPSETVHRDRRCRSRCARCSTPNRQPAV